MIIGILLDFQNFLLLSGFFFWEIFGILALWVGATGKEWSTFGVLYVHDSLATLVACSSSVLLLEAGKFLVLDLSDPFDFWIERAREEWPKSTGFDNDRSTSWTWLSFVFCFQFFENSFLLWICDIFEVFAGRIIRTPNESTVLRELVNKF